MIKINLKQISLLSGILLILFSVLILVKVLLSPTNGGGLYLSLMIAFTFLGIASSLIYYYIKKEK
ncbi:hypothetical protein XO10_10265 [Marinitoga sp. 1135]|nr:hypothetical protein [Marinitoga sp. 1135]NUU98545.1 hypothetical protein [Marinitoga sp. 1138]